MFFFNLRGLRDRLIAQPLSQREVFRYLVGIFFVHGVMDTLSAFSPKPDPSGMALFVVIPLTLLFFGIFFYVLRWLFECNGGEAGEHFLSNLLAVSFVVYCWYISVLLPLSALSAMAIALLQFTLKGHLGGGETPLLLLISIVSMLVLFGGGAAGIVATGRTLREIRGRRQQVSAPSSIPQ